MNKRYFTLAVLAIFLFFSNVVLGQLVSDDIFLQGKFLEVAVAPNGAWGNTVAPPAGYHTNSGGFTGGYPDPVTGTAYSGTATMDFQYDANHDGWGVAIAGSVNFYGPYYLPGTPFDGWSIQVNGVREDAFYNNSGFTGTLTGTNVSYSNVGGIASGVWQGTAAGGALSIRETNRVDTLSSWDVVTIVFKNTTAAVLNNVYYLATADPDNDEVTTGGSFPTNNIVKFQNDFRHRVMVEGRPPSIHQDAYSSLCTRDCRAKAFIYQSWPPTTVAGNNLDLMYAGTATGIGTVTSAINTMTYSQDIAYGLVYKLGNIAAGDSTIVSFAWNFKDSTCTDSAFPDPVLVVNGTKVAQPDTFNVCAHPGVTTVPVNILYGNDKDWSWGSWTWSPATGLASTTGVTNTINIGALSGTTTYTITGNDSTTGMHSCNNYVLYLTVITCFQATNNGPLCPGDMLFLGATGDSVGATYQWFNPGGVMFSTLHHPIINPVTYADSGLYTVVRTMGGASDTSKTRVIIHWKPTLTLTSNAPLCYGMVDTLRLNATPDSVGETFSWTGPAGFTSTLFNPTIPGYTAADSGVYTVIAVSQFGCKDTAKIDAGIIPQPPTPVLSGVTNYCSGTPFVPFTVTGYTGTLYWYTVGTGGVGSTTAPTVNTSYGGTYTFWVSQKIGACESLRDSITVQVVVTPNPPVITGTTTYCEGATYVPPTAVGTNILWYITPVGGIGTATVPTINTMAPGVTTIYATQSDSGCTSARAPFTVTVNVVPAPPAISGVTVYCQNDVPVPFILTGVTGTVLWYTTATGGVGSTTPTPINTATPGVTTYWVSQTNGACESSRVSITVHVHPTPATPVITGDTSYCQYVPYVAPAAVTTGTGVILWYTTVGGVGTLTPPTISTILPGFITIYAAQSDSGCLSPLDSIVIDIHPKPNPPYIIDSPDHYCPGQAFDTFKIITGTNVLWYSTAVGGVGSTTSLTVNTGIPGVHWVWATQTVSGCTSDRAAISVTVYDSVIAGFTDHITLGCNGDSVQFTNTSTGATAYEWSYGDGYSSAGIDPLHIYHLQGSFTITLYARTSKCVDSIKHTISLVHPLSADFTFTPGDTVCQFSPVTFTSVTPAITPSYLWNFADGTTNITANPVHSFLHPGVYPVALTVTDFVPCSTTVIKNVIVDTLSQMSLEVSDSTFCQGTFATFTGLFGSFGNTGLTWDFGDGNNNNANENPVRHGYYGAGTYTVKITATYSACPEISASRKIIVEPQPQIDLGADTSICPGSNPILITDKINGGTLGATWHWNTGQSSTSIYVTEPGVYKATVDIGGCYTTDSIIVTSNCFMNIPNIFTPNGDGVNDYFYPRQYLTKGLTSFKMDIFNRWGELIFETSTIDGRGWDGRFNDVNQPEGVYIYIIDASFIDGQKEHHQGNITLLR